MKTIFVVDDDGLMREMLTRTLRKHGFRVKAFDSPASLLERFEFEYPQAVVSDVNEVPVILMSAHLSDDVVSQAEALGVERLVSKPIRDIDSFVSCIRDAVDDLRSAAEGRGLDRMRFRFLTNLSHELRTPLTAIKIALDGLFNERGETLAPQERRLVDIGQRNVDRIIHVVEEQLDLLQLALGDVSVERRLVDLNELIREASGSEDNEKKDGEPAANGRKICVFTDPDRLSTILRHLFKAGRSEGPVSHAVKLSPGSVRIEFRNTVFLAADEPSGRTMDFLREPALANGISGFARGVFEQLVQALDGSIQTLRNGDNDSVCLSLPVAPSYEQDADFDRPLASLRKAATLSGRGLTLFRCRIACDEKATPFVTREFLRRCLTTLSEGDMLVRGKVDNTYYLALVARDPEQIEHVLSLLNEPLASGGRSNSGHVEATLVRSILPGEMPTEDLLPVLETV
jgi:CheY-like chemotaxis protein